VKLTAQVVGSMLAVPEDTEGVLVRAQVNGPVPVSIGAGRVIVVVPVEPVPLTALALGVTWMVTVLADEVCP
jgi:hypothetical protein